MLSLPGTAHPWSWMFPFQLWWIINGYVQLMRVTNTWVWQDLAHDRHLWTHAYLMSHSQVLQLYQCPLRCQWLFLKTRVSTADGICTQTPRLFIEILPVGLAMGSRQPLSHYWYVQHHKGLLDQMAEAWACCRGLSFSRKEHSPVDPLILAQWSLYRTSNLQNSKTINCAVITH